MSIVPQAEPMVPATLYNTRGGLGYVQFCADCHRTDGAGVDSVFPALVRNPTVGSPDPSTLLHIAPTGWKTAQTTSRPRTYTMPAFNRLSDAEIAEILTFVRGGWGNDARPVDAGDARKFRRQLELKAADASAFATPHLANLLDQPNAAQLVRGARLHLETAALLPRNVANGLNCTSCHLNAGTVADGSPFVGVSAFFPSHAPRAGRVISLEERINGCFRRSMHGEKLYANQCAVCHGRSGE